MLRYNQMTQTSVCGRDLNVLGSIYAYSLIAKNLSATDLTTTNITNTNLIDTQVLDTNSINFFQSITLEDISGSSLAVLDKHTIGTCAKLDIFDTSSGAPQKRVYLSSNPAQNGFIKNPFTFSETNTGTDASSQLEVHSTTKGFLPPRMTQTQKLAISSPAQGLEVYDTTINSKSYYNGINWFVPSYISFKLSVTDTTPSTILWDNFTTSNDARIGYNAGTGIFSFSDYGTYIVNVSGFFLINSAAPERNIQLLLVNNTTSVTHTVVSTSIAGLIEAGNTYVSASMSPLLIVDFTTGLNFRFDFQSLNDNTIRFSAASHGFIKRIL